MLSLSFPDASFDRYHMFLAGPAAPAGAGVRHGMTHRMTLAARPAVGGLTGMLETSSAMTCPLLFWR